MKSRVSNPQFSLNVFYSHVLSSDMAAPESGANNVCIPQMPSLTWAGFQASPSAIKNRPVRKAFGRRWW